MLEIVIAICLSSLAAICWVSNVLGLPGNWGIAALAVLCWYLPDPSAWLAVSGTAVVAIGIVCGLGEAIETIAGMLGVQKVGGDRKSAWYALVGSLVGAVAGLFLGSGVPIVGNVIGSLVGSALGAAAGSIYGERMIGQPWNHSLQVGKAAMIGRVLGTAAKLGCGSVAFVIFVTAVWF